MAHPKFQALLLSVALLQFIMLGAVWSRLSKLESTDRAITQTTTGAAESFQETRLSANRIAMSESDLTVIVRDVLRRELRDTLQKIQNTDTHRKSGRHDSAIAQHEKPMTHEQRLTGENAANESQEIVTRAVRMGIWTREDSERLYSRLPDLTEEQRIQLLDQFHGAVNRQELELEDVPVL